MALVEAAAPDVGANFAGCARDKDTVDLICKALMQSTDELLQKQVDQISSSAADHLKTSFDIRQDQVNAALTTELKTCWDKMHTLEVEKEQMEKSVKMLEEQFATLSAMAFGKTCGWPSQCHGMGGNFVNAGMIGAFATSPNDFPGLPDPALSEPALSEVSTSAPPSPYLAPFAPSRRQSAPPGLSAWLRSPQPHPSPPPGLDSPPKSPPGGGATISLSEAIAATPELKARPAPVVNARLSSEDMHRKALAIMLGRKDSGDDADSMRFLSPSREATPSRNVAQSLSSPKVNTLNLTPKRTPSRLKNGRLTPGMKSPAVTPSPFVICETGGTIFGFTIRKADDCSLGLDVNHNDCGNYLEVTGVKSGGAMQAWNKLCVGGPAAGKALMPGDRVVKVNAATTAREMLQECTDKKLLAFTVQRGEVDDDFDPLGLESECRNRFQTY